MCALAHKSMNAKYIVLYIIVLEIVSFPPSMFILKQVLHLDLFLSAGIASVFSSALSFLGARALIGSKKGK